MNESIWQRFEAKIECIPFHTCWEWTAALDRKGYGRFSDGQGKHYIAHRLAYERWCRPIDPNLTIDHLCRNHSCVNPNHLEQVTRGQNVLRGIGPTAINAAKTACIRGHKYTAETTYVYAKTGYRLCKPCQAQKYRERHRHMGGT